VHDALEDRDQDAEGVVAEHGALCDARDHLVLGHRDREPVAIVDVQHYVHIGTAVANVDRPVRRRLEAPFELFDHRHLAVPRGNAADRSHLTGPRIEVELGADDVLGGDRPGERGLHEFLRRRGNDKEREADAVETPRQKLDERRDVAAQADAAAGLDQVLAADAAKLGVVADQIRELAPLLHEIRRRKALDLALKIRHADQFGEDLAGVVEAERLVEV
jgi:hypothetical protein